jgi:hypothetical protein
MAKARTSEATEVSDLAEPAHPRTLAALVYALGTMLLAYPALAGKFLINARSDQYLAGYAFRDFAAQSLKSGHGFPQWNPFIQGGMPYIAAMHGDIFYPTFLLRWLLPTDVAMTWEFIIHLFLCGFFTFLFLRAWRFGFWPALIGGLAYMLGGSIAGYASPGHDGKLFVGALTPAGLLLITHAVRDGRTWAWGAFAFTVGMTFLTPHPQLFQYFLILCGCYALYVAFANVPGRGQLPRDVAIRRIVFALGCVLIGILMGAVQFWPALIEYKPWSPRAGGHDWATATSFSFPIEETLNWYWPQFSGMLDEYWGRNQFHLHSDYFGVVVLMLAGAAFGMTERVSFRRLWIAVFIVSLLWAFGGFTPLYHVIMLIPYTKYLRAPSTMIYVTAFSTSVLAAMGVERVIAGRVGVRYALGWIAAGAVFGLLMSVGGYTALANAVASSVASDFPEGVRGQIMSHFTGPAEANTSAAIAGVWRSFLFAALAGGVLWAVATGRIAIRGAVYTLAALVAVDLWSIERNYWLFSPRASVLFASDAAIDAIKADIAKTGQPARVLNRYLGQGVVAELGRPDRAFSGDKLMVHGIRVPKGYHGNELGMYQDLIGPDSALTDVRPEFWKHENVQYWYADVDTVAITKIAGQLGVQPFTRLAGPTKSAAGSTVYAYKLAGDYPPAWVASAMIKAPQNQALGTVLDPRFDQRTVAIVDTSATNIQAAQIQTLPAAATTRVRVSNYAPGSMDIALDAPSVAGQALVVSENYFPGWQATVDGKAAPVALMDYNLVGVALPAGAKNVQLRFIDAAYEKGRLVTWVALVLSLALWIGGWLADRRRTAPMPVAA